ncbi:MAG: glycosyltransferase, partial [Patescibacteria group bacterium]
QQRISKYYRRQAKVINPPVEFDQKNHGQSITDGDYYLCLGRLIPYKKADLVVEAFVQNGRQLKVGGEGPLFKRMQKISNQSDKIELLGYVSDNEKWELIAGCRALIFPAEEDFGIVPLEVMSLGKPVIAYGQGGARETVKEGESGTFFAEQTVSSINKAIEKFEKMDFDHEAIKIRAARFGKSRFKQEIIDFLICNYKIWI